MNFYLPKGKEYKYLDIDNDFMYLAMKAAKSYSLTPKTPIGVVFVKNGKVLIEEGSGSDYHQKHGCERIRLGLPSGIGYDKCPGCSYENHAEAKAFRKSKKEHIDLSNSDLYMFGIFWACEPCWKILEKLNIQNVFLMKNAKEFFNRDDPNNRCGDYEFFENRRKEKLYKLLKKNK